jgi:hypothetical protein
MDRDKLMGPPTLPLPNDAVSRPMRSGKWLISSLLAVTLMLAITVAYLVGQKTTEQPAVPSTPQPKPVAIAPKSVPAVKVPKVEKPVQPKLVLSAIVDSDWKKLGMGCACTFEVGKKALFVTGGDDLAIFRPNGERKICSVSSEQFTQLYENNEGRIDCGGSRISLKGRGEVSPGFDGHATSAKMTAISGGQEVTLSGNWNCGC